MFRIIRVILYNCKNKNNYVNENVIKQIPKCSVFLTNYVHNTRISKQIITKNENQIKSISSPNELKIIKFLKQALTCEQDDLEGIKKSLNAKTSLKLVESNIKLLNQHKVHSKAIIENPRLVAAIKLNTKIDIVKSMCPKYIEDFIPLLNLTVAQLIKVKKRWEADLIFLEGHPNFRHRIYYFSHYFRVEPVVVSRHFAENPFMLQTKFNSLAKKLAIFLQYHIKPTNILRDLGTFRHSEKIILRRLEQAKLAGLKNTMPWMIKCMDENLEKSIQKNNAELTALGEHKDIKSYLAERLKLSEEKATFILNNYKRLSRSRVSRIKPILDYLLNETPYTEVDITNSPRILYFSLKTIRQRIEELKLTNNLPKVLDKLAQGEKRVKKLIEPKKNKR